MDQNDVGWKDLFNIISGVNKICVSLKTDIVNSHLTQNTFVLIDLDEFIRIHDLFSKCSFTTITGKHDSIPCIIGPFEEQFPA